MFTAFDTRTKSAVIGPEVDDRTEHENETMECSSRYRCLACNARLEYERNPEDGPFNYFTRITGNGDCINDGNVSLFHRLGQEIIVKTIFNWLPQSGETVHFEIEKRVGSPSNFVISDVIVSEPAQIAIEVVYLNNQICLQRRLKTLLTQGYSVMYIFLTNGQISPTQAEHHLQKIFSIQVGRFDPQSLDLRLGSVVSPENTDPDDLDWDSVPDYLS